MSDTNELRLEALHAAIDWAADRADTSGYHPSWMQILERADQAANWLTTGELPAHATDTSATVASADDTPAGPPKPGQHLPGRRTA